MVVIRLARAGKKGSPIFKVMVADKNAKLTGRFLEKVGIYVPRPNKDGKDSLSLVTERFTHWVKLGAIATPRLKTLIKTHKIDVITESPVSEKAPKAAKVAKPAAAPKAEVKAAPTKAAAPAKKAAPKKKA